MKILEVRNLAIEDVKVIKYARFCDHRGYFTETYRKADFKKLDVFKDVEFIQSNESYSKKGVIRGLHFQWNPYMGKLIRTLRGRMVDMVMDIRKGSKTFGKIIAYDMPAGAENDFGEWIWVPVGFAHGNFFPEDTQIEYYCSGDWSPKCEAGISPLAKDIDWSLCDPSLKKMFDDTVKTSLMTDKDRDGYTLEKWLENKDSDNFIYGKV